MDQPIERTAPLGEPGLRDPPGLRALKLLVIVMGVLIVAGVGVIAVTVARRMSAPAAPAPTAQFAPAVAGAHTLDEPEGTRIVGMAATADQLALRLEGGGPDRVVFVDPRTGGVVGRLALPR
jgi:hypothetical protein